MKPDYARNTRRGLSLTAAGWCWLAMFLMLIGGSIWGIVT